MFKLLALKRVRSFFFCGVYIADLDCLVLKLNMYPFLFLSLSTGCDLSMNPNYIMAHHHLPGPSSQPHPPYPPNSSSLLPSIGSMVPPEAYNMGSAPPAPRFSMPPHQNQVNYDTPTAPHINYAQPPISQVGYSPSMNPVNYSSPTTQVNIPPAHHHHQVTPPSSTAQVNMSTPPVQTNMSPSSSQMNVSSHPNPSNISSSPNQVGATPAGTSSKASPCQSPTSDSSVETLPNPNQTLAGKLAKNVRRSKRQRAPAMDVEMTATFLAKLARPSKPAAESRPMTAPAPATSSEEHSDCPKEYLTDNAYTDRMRFNNEVAKVVYKEDFARVGSKEEFQKYLAVQQKWRWEIHNLIKTLEVRVHNLVANKNCGIAQNVMRYSTVPINCKSDDVRRCERTAKELEKMGVRIAEAKADITLRKKLLFEDQYVDPVQGEIDFLDNMISKIIQMEENVDRCLTSVQTTLQSICRRFTTESVEAAEMRRLKRRRKENIKKKRKSMERQQEKRVIDVLLRLTSKEVAERVLTTNDATKICIPEINPSSLQQMSTDAECVALRTIVARNYLDDHATKLVRGKLGEH